MRVTVLAKTNAKKNEVSVREDGSLLVTVAAIPEKGKANQAIEKAVAKHYGVAPSTVRVFSGQTSRRKIIKISKMK